MVCLILLCCAITGDDGKPEAPQKSALARGLAGLVLYEGRWQPVADVERAAAADRSRYPLIQEYLERRAAAPSLADPRLKLAAWCADHGLKEQAFAHYVEVTRLDPARNGLETPRVQEARQSVGPSARGGGTKAGGRQTEACRPEVEASAGEAARGPRKLERQPQGQGERRSCGRYRCEGRPDGDEGLRWRQRADAGRGRAIALADSEPAVLALSRQPGR